MSIKIEKGIDIPEKKVGKKRKYPFDKMEVGDSFLYDKEKYSRKVLNKLNTCARVYGKSRDVKFSFRKQGDFLRCWRIK